MRAQVRQAYPSGEHHDALTVRPSTGATFGPLNEASVAFSTRIRCKAKPHNAGNRVSRKSSRSADTITLSSMYLRRYSFTDRL
jgi:hypothetical protein